MTLSLIAASLILGGQEPTKAVEPPRTYSVPAMDTEPNVMKVIDRNKAYADYELALTKLMRGNRRFIEGKSIHPRQGRAALDEVAKGQKPFAMIIGCSDSRVPAEIVFDQGLGDLFIIRTAGQVAANASYGTMEFGTSALGSKLIVVLGHDKCGAVDAALKRPENVPGHIVTLVNSIKQVSRQIEGKSGDRLSNAIRQNVINQVEELRDLEPILTRQYMRGEILIVGAVYHLEDGRVEFLPETLSGLPMPASKRAK